jgi:hypothetical protein
VTGAEEFQFPPDVRAQAWDEIAQVHKRMDARRAAAPSAPGKTGTQPTAPNARPAGATEPKITQAERQHVAQAINSGTFDQWMGAPQLQNPTLRQRAKRIYRMLTGSDWKGGK